MMGLGLCVAGADAQWARYGKLKGRVVNAANGAPVSGLKIEIVNLRETTTDQDGKYEFDRLLRGTYKVIIKNSEYDEHRKTITIQPDQTVISNLRVLPLKAPRPTR